MAAVLLACGPARADVVYSLAGVTFADGGTATGYIDVNVYGEFAGFDIVTTPGTGAFATGYEYSGGVTPSAVLDGGTLLVFSRLNYVGGLALRLPIPVIAMPSAEPIVLGPQSFECDTYLSLGNTCSVADQRLVTAGVLVPEPTSLAVLGAGLALLGLTLRRRAG